MKKRMIFYDTETTGIRFDKDKIIEIAAYDKTTDRTFSRLVNPKMAIPPEATAIHNISDEMVKDAPTFDIIAQEFIEFCTPNSVLIAHNNDNFDKPFLETEFRNAGVEMPAWSYLDSLKWARKYRNDLPKHSLQFLREAYGIPANQAHRALDDVVVLSEICSILFDDLPVETLLELLSQSAAIARMPFGKYQGQPLSDVPASYVTWLLNNGALDKPGNKELKEGFEKLGLLSPS
jgi:DNA polymerase III subunit epsilon